MLLCDGGMSILYVMKVTNRNFILFHKATWVACSQITNEQPGTWALRSGIIVHDRSK